MNDGLESVKERLDENDIAYTEEDNTLIINNYNKEIGLSIRYIIVVAETVKPTYKITVISSSITKANNELEMLKTLNNINNKESIIRYVMSDEKTIHIMAVTLSQLNVVADDALTLLLCLDQDITENYKELMKSNWSEEVL